MSLFSAMVKVAVDVATLPVAIAKDVLTLGNAGNGKPFIQQKIDEIKKDSED